MKRAIFLLCACLPVFGAGSVWQSVAPIGIANPQAPDTRVYGVSIVWTGDATTGTVPSTLINITPYPALQGMRLISAEIQPNTPSPTGGYSITLTDPAGIDLLQGSGANLSATNAAFTGSVLSPPMLASPTFNLSGNSVASAKGTVTLFFAPLSVVAGARGLPATLPVNNTFTGTNTFTGPHILSGTTTFNTLISTYNSTATAGQGVAWIPCVTFQKTETAADTNLLTCPIPAVAGSYRVRFALTVTASNTATLGWTATWTDAGGNAQAPTNIPELAAATAGSATSTLTQGFSGITGLLYGYADLDVNNSGTSIVVKLTFSGTSFTGKATATVERLV